MQEFSKELGYLSKEKASGRATGMMPEDTCNKTVQEVMKLKGVSKNRVMALVSGLMQNGGSNKSAGTLIVYQLGTVTLNAQEFNTCFAKVRKGATPKQFCRAMRDVIYDCSVILGEEGDLARQMSMTEPMMTKDDAIWCSNFQTGNPRCPERVRVWLTANYDKRFRN